MAEGSTPSAGPLTPSALDEPTGELERLPTVQLKESASDPPRPSVDARDPAHPKPADPSEPSLDVPSPLLPEPRTTSVAGTPFAGLLAEAAKPPRKPSPQPHSPKDTVEMGVPGRDAVTVTKPAPVEERRIGPYRVLEELGSGGMAVVYKAVQPSLDRLVAIKELRPEYVHDRQIAARFSREATSLANLQHNNIVHIYDYLIDYESAHIVMEYVEGIDLFDLLAKTDRVPPEVAAIIATQVAAGLEYAHYRNIVHRDIKPSNLLIAKNGEVKVMDFGIAREWGNSELTQVGIAVGTPAYMAPEQIRGDRIDFRTDIFALGIVLYEMISGEKPWPEEEGRSVTVKVLDEPPRPIRSRVPDVPVELERIIDRCLAKDPALRYPTTYQLRRDLERYVQRMVPTDPRGRLVLFLRNRELISEGEASNFVQPELLKDTALKRRDQGIPLPPARALLRPVAAGHAVALLCIAVAGLLSIFAPVGERLDPERPRMLIAGSVSLGQPEARPAEARAAPLHAAEDEPGAPRLGALGGGPKERARTGTEGFVRVLVDPWARVYVDGERYDTTPFAEPIALVPGQHRLGFRNPYFKPVDRYVEVVRGETLVVKVTLAPLEEAEPPKGNE